MKKQNEENMIKEENKRQQHALKQDYEAQIKLKEISSKYEKLFEQNLEKQLLV